MLKKHQRGVSLSGLLVWSFIIVIVVMGGMKVVPSVLEYYSIGKSIKAMVSDNHLKSATALEIRQAFDKRAEVGYITEIKGSDLDISKDGSDLVISFAYAKKIHLAGPVSLYIDFQGSAKGG
ncbi:MAG TPA: DUF4845 domain-containing protein [Azospira sp.]|nr:DUF4845 domain-containing protein [Azospira sp.]